MSFTLLDLLVQWFPVADLPEYIIRTYLAGDVCLNHCDTIYKVFTKIYTKEGWETIEDPQFGNYGHCWMTKTYLDPKRKILHSFNDQPAIVCDFEKGNRKSMRWYKNGFLHRECGPYKTDLSLYISNNNRPATIDTGGVTEHMRWYVYGQLIGWRVS